jgi:hypothetical protein
LAHLARHTPDRVCGSPHGTGGDLRGAGWPRVGRDRGCAPWPARHEERGAGAESEEGVDV